MQHNLAQPNSELLYLLRRLPMAGTVLHIGAHPDDEDVGLMAYLARKEGVRAVYWSATRGEGGQNRIGPYTGTRLGIYRTWESQKARAVDGGEALFGSLIDFGFSKHGAEALEKWGWERTVREIVRAIRLVQPQIVIGRWNGTERDGHGHHQAIGEATLAAFGAAGDPSQFPELRSQGLAPWQPAKLYYSTMGDWQPGEDVEFGKRNPELERFGTLRLNTGEFDPIAGRTYQEQAWIGFNAHQTQAMGIPPEPGNFYYYYLRHQSLVSTPEQETSFYDGLDPSLTGLADFLGQGCRSLRAYLAEIKGLADAAIDLYQPMNPLAAAQPLCEGVSLLRELQQKIQELAFSDDTRQALQQSITWKLSEFEAAATRCLGLRLEALSDDARITPGQRFQLSAKLWHPQTVSVDQVDFSPRIPPGWSVQQIDLPDTSLSGEQAQLHEMRYTITAAKNSALACPYWLREASDAVHYYYAWPTDRPTSSAFDEPLVQVSCTVTLGHHQLHLSQSAVLREGFAGGYRELPMAIIPPISIHPEAQRLQLQLQKEEQTLSLYVVVRSNMEHSGVDGTLSLQVPDGWQVEPQQVALAMGPVGNSRSLRFTVVIPAHTKLGSYSLRYVIQSGGRAYDVVLDEVRLGTPGLPKLPDEATCIQEVLITQLAEVTLQILDIKFIPNLSYAYVAEANDEIIVALEHFGLDFHLVTDQEMAFLDLTQFDAVIIGPNAYLVRDELRKNAARFLDYVEQGGTLIVQYQAYDYQDHGFTPYPFQYHQPHDRVTYEDTPVDILVPDHPLVNQPNQITEADFDNWVIERGLYFFGNWDPRYEPIFACNDPNEQLKKGGMLFAPYGRGTYIYAAYSFFRQLPEGIPGALRLFANLLAWPATRPKEPK